MIYIWLTEAQVQLIANHALNDSPNEACGLLVGEGVRVTQIIPTQNTSSDPQHRFTIDPIALAHHLPEIEANNQSLIGFYHSHPDGDPIPSQTDIREATYPNVIHLIAGLKSGKPKLGAWHIDGIRVDPVALHISPLPPPKNLTHAQHQLSTAQKNAIIITAILALIVMLVLSIHLLPPAPPIPTP